MDWQDISTAPRDGTVCRLLFRDAAGTYTNRGEYFLHDDGNWYRADPPALINQRAVYKWRPLPEPPK